ncbi:hypothetical protein GCM10012275_59090 [Longimycelium tulufanense]|uniref:Uncharacterized protein n=1 Tax=Longimycelium tulufanense TaxID=907463 RepID=A0A8J3FWV2_9PSEU|nr:hypothetical protein GCM10012275_59090 [Longimycelium tulufanense]
MHHSISVLALLAGAALSVPLAAASGVEATPPPVVQYHHNPAEPFPLPPPPRPKPEPAEVAPPPVPAPPVVDSDPGCGTRAVAEGVFNPACSEYQGYLDPGTSAGRGPTSGELQFEYGCRMGYIPSAQCKR